MTIPQKNTGTLVFICIWLLTACQVVSKPNPNPTPTVSDSIPPEIEVQEIFLTRPAASRLAEISGMAWYGDILILLPQYPDRFGEKNSGAVFALSKTEILSYLDDRQSLPLNPLLIPFNDGGLHNEIKGFEGFEAIAFDGEIVYLTIEASPKQMRGYVVSGKILPDLSEIKLDPNTLVEIPLQAQLANSSDESILFYNNHIFTLFEANGEKVNPDPVAQEFNLALQPTGTLAFPNIEYRITDATPPDRNGNFWAINFYFPLDVLKLKPQNDLLAESYGLGKTHRQNLTVERLVEFHFGAGEIDRVDIPPVQLHLEGDIAPRNWEGIVLLDQRGFLLATDKFPRTIFGFVPYEYSK